MIILSIETSCDDTGITIMEAKGETRNPSFEILADNLASQTKIHIKYGGVFPVLAKKEHKKNLPILLEQTLRQAKLKDKKSPVDVIAVTYGPGLEMCLWEGITFAQDLAKKWNIPVIPVNHMEGHVFSVFGKNKPARNASRSDSGGGKFKIPKVHTPILSLLVSGGHTQLVLSKQWMKYEIIGETMDDAVGEAFDKVARMLDLPYPGGPEISRLVELERKSKLLRVRNFPTEKLLKSRAVALRTPYESSFSFSLPRPMLYSKNFDFSFAGLKTAVLYLIRKIGKLDEETKSKIALEFENSAIECLVYKTKKAIEKYKIKTLIVAGGVAINKHLRNEVKKSIGKNIKLFLPTKELSRDNSIMIGIAGYLNYIKNKKKIPKLDNIKATGNLSFSQARRA